MLKQVVVGIVVNLMLLGAAAAAPVDDDINGFLMFIEGVGAYEHGDYETALKAFRNLAEQGDAAGQYRLGIMYMVGKGVPQDFVLAYMWFNLAAAKGGEDPMKYRDLVANRMTQNQLAEAQRLAREWKPSSER